MDMIDIIIPVYNVEKYLKKCINSVLHQTYKNYQIILIDDGSTDSSGKICDEYANRFAQITVKHQPNGGLSAARNTGLSMSSSQYIMFIDSDDWIEPNTLEILFQKLTQNKADIVCCGFFFQFENYQKTWHKNTSDKNYIYNSQEAIKTFFLRKKIGAAAWGKLYNRKLFENVSYPVGEIHEDIAIIIQLLSKASTIIYCPIPLWHYRQQEGSLSRNIYSKKNYVLYNHLISLSSILKKYPNLQEEYEGYFYVGIKSLLSLFKTNEVRIKYASDYNFFRTIRKKGLYKILTNKTIELKEKISILLIGSSFHKYIKHFKI